MPYIRKSSRELLDKGIIPETSGDLNYLITKLVHLYIVQHGKLSYTILNEVVGVLELPTV